MRPLEGLDHIEFDDRKSEGIHAECGSDARDRLPRAAQEGGSVLAVPCHSRIGRKADRHRQGPVHAPTHAEGTQQRVVEGDGAAPLLVAADQPLHRLRPALARIGDLPDDRFAAGASEFQVAPGLGRKADADAEREHRQQRDDQRRPRPHQHPAEDIAAERVGAASGGEGDDDPDGLAFVIVGARFAEALIAACNRYLEKAPRDFITFEYVMLEGVNDADEQARELVALASRVRCKFNLIPFNPFPNSGFRRSSAERIRRFSEVLQRAGLTVTTRRTRGDEIAAACGQLAGNVADRTRRKLVLKEARP